MRPALLALMVCFPIFSFAQAKSIGELRCLSTDQTYTRVLARLTGENKGLGFEVHHADIYLQRGNARSEFVTIQSWGKIKEDKSTCYFCYEFRSPEVRLVAWPVALPDQESFFRFGTEEIKLTCRFRWFRNFGPVDE